MKLCGQDKCTSCGACVSVCPQNCIKLKKDKFGFEYPAINNDLCIDCGRCNKVCHVINDSASAYPCKAYAVWSRDENDRKTSTSGGAASVFYNITVSNGGVGYGAVLDDNLNAVIRGFSNSEIIKFKNSKYVHSNMLNAFADIKSDLKSGENVVFIGLPCQVAAIKTFLGKDFDNLILVDLICHGTPPQQYLDEHILNINSKYRNETGEIKFRDDNDYRFKCYSSGDRKLFYEKTKETDTFLLSFIKSLDCYESCYSCKYAKNERVSDITIGDFWGLGKENPFNHPYTGAVSLVLINSKKGNDFFDKAKDKLFVEEREVKEGIDGNAQLNFPSKKNEHREQFLDLYQKGGFEFAVQQIYGKYIKKQYIKQIIKSIIIGTKGVIKKIIRRK